MLLKEKDQIIEWLNKYEVKNYTLRPDDTYGYVVDVAGNVDLWNDNLIAIPVKFGHVKGSFNCGDHQLTSLEGCPQEIEKDFWCQDNQLTSLEGGPQHVGRNFLCNGNKLTSLQGSPQTIGEGFYCYNNQLTSLEGAPHSVGEFFSCSGNPDLGELQDITDFQLIQSYFLSQKLANELNTKDNKKKIKL